MAKPFKAVINLDIRDSTPDWGPFLAERAPHDSPNVLVVLVRRHGLAAGSPFGGRIEMPTLQRLATVIGSSFALSYQEDDHGGAVIYKSGIDFVDDGPEKPVRIWSRIG